MIHTTDPDHTVPAEGGNARRVQLVDDLRLMHKPAPHLARADDAVMRAIHAERRTAPALPQIRRRLHLRLSLPLVAILAAVLGVGAYVHQQTPATASAQVILQHAAKAGLVADQVTRFVYQVSSSTGYAGTSDVWVRADASGAPQQVATGTGDTIALHLARALEVYSAEPASDTESQVTGHTTLDGVQVDEIQPYAGGPTIYVDATSYLVRGADWTEKEGSDAGSTWQARLTQFGTVPGSSVPATYWHPHSPTT
jgi:hypothetical protein